MTNITLCHISLSPPVHCPISELYERYFILAHVTVTVGYLTPNEVRTVTQARGDADKVKMEQGHALLPIMPHAGPCLWITWPSLPLPRCSRCHQSATDLPLLIPPK